MGFNPVKTKVQLKLAVNRLKLLQQKKAAGNGAARREIAQLLENHKEESARVRVEHIIREDFVIEAMEILELYCEMLLARFGLLEEMRHCDPSIAEAVNTIIYAAPRCDVKELLQVRDQLIMKFGKDFGVAAIENINDVVNSRIVHKLRVQTPDPLLVDQYLKTIATSFKIEWDGGSMDQASLLDPLPAPPSIPDVSFNLPQQFPVDSLSSLNPTSQLDLGPSLKPASKAEAPGLDGSVLNLPSPPSQPAASKPPENDYDELTRRFEALKRRK
ncbi:hypothetical protein HDU97_006518 [Phlyctochytrium planicorne]|nr:hypothetical protein HDU97_006518 [Phlyctochytrium planicorne]